MSDNDKVHVKPNRWRYVEVGRVVLLTKGKHQGNLAVIAEIVDHKRVLVDGPTTGVPRQALALNNLVMTPLIVSNLPRAARSGVVSKKFVQSGVEQKWKESSWAKKLASQQRRRELTDFDRFKVMLLKKQVSVLLTCI